MNNTASTDPGGIRGGLHPIILIADDTQSSRELLRSILEAGGYGVIEAEDGEQAIEMAFASDPDLIILDLHMPKLDGRDVAAQLRRAVKFQKTPIIALTAAVSESMPEQIAQAGFTDYLAKPIGPARLREFIARLLKSTQAVMS